MAEPLGLASAILALATFALKASVTLYDDVKKEVLEMLMKTVGAAVEADFSALKIPLQQCGEACEEFGIELAKCSTRSSTDRTSFRDWTKMKYMGEDIGGFRQQLAGYKSTINIALADTTLRTPSITTERLESHKELIKNTTDDLETRLQEIDGKLESLLARFVPASDSDSDELRRIRDERLSTENGLQICHRLSDFINEIQLGHTERSGDPRAAVEPMLSPDKIINESLQACAGSLKSAAAQLEELEESQRKEIDRLISRAKLTMSDLDAANLERLRNERNTTSELIRICRTADIRLQQKASVIENYATGDQTVQFLVSTNERTINGKNSGFGWAQRQIGGHMNDETVQQLSRDAFKSVIRHNRKNEEVDSQNQPLSHLEPSNDDGNTSKFSDQYSAALIRHRLLFDH
ncbi:hypothetical protein FocTR4_00010869 [Fusarium oxysporum f. sp. cubense]|uniref:Azaphilone pigments biosynthesis cluster protein L N-terminal domain-containing protein n=1 Tax=Fusarium oxysporum f. sp. cubense TaxID=61366 RepID=A0A5C6T5M0_FUSOC|nr:hypothetical protein FocTR4_00010869 [Fusarium oxysporum f. sp. cubense]